jgi:hypothetical protein
MLLYINNITILSFYEVIFLNYADGPIISAAPLGYLPALFVNFLFPFPFFLEYV